MYHIDGKGKLTILLGSLTEHLVVLPVLLRLGLLGGFHGREVVFVIIHETLLLRFGLLIVILSSGLRLI